MHCPHCRAALPAGSRFCNSCGAAIAAAPAPHAPAAPAPGYAPQQTVYGAPQPGYGAAPAGYSPGPYGAPGVAAPVGTGRKPVLLLAALLVLILGLVGGAAVLVVRNRAGSVVGGKQPLIPTGQGVQQAANPEAPRGPGALSSQGQMPPSGQPLTAAPRQPDGMAPSVLMAPGSQTPSAPSVTSVRQPALPNAPSAVSVTPQPGPAAPPVVGQRARAAAPQPTPDNSDFDRYIRWLRFVENERRGLRAKGENEIFRLLPLLITGGFDIQTLSDPDADPQEMNRRRLQATFNETLRAMNITWANIRRTKPAVPSDCRALDSYYMAGMEEEMVQTANVLRAFTAGNIGDLKSIGGRAVANIDEKLGLANRELESAFRQRGLNQQFRIETGGGSSMLGGLKAPGLH